MFQNPEGHKFDIMWGKNSDTFTSTLPPMQEDLVKTYDKMFSPEKGKGIIGGGISQIESKRSPVVSLLSSMGAVGANRNFFGGKITKPEDTQLQKVGKSLGYIANQNMDIPIGAQNISKLIAKGNRNPQDYIISGVGLGTVGKNPANEKQETIFKRQKGYKNLGIPENDATMKEMDKLYTETNKTTSFLPVVPRSIKINGKPTKLNPQQHDAYEQKVDKISYYLRKKAVNSKTYKMANTEEKLKYFDSVNKSVKQAVRIMMFNDSPKKYNKYTQEILDNYDTFTK